MQMCEVKEAELIEIERTIFKYLWNKKWVGNQAPDRIKRLTLKQQYNRGGLQAPDIGNINTALKVRQFLRAMITEHPISLIQKFQLEKIGYDEYYKNEFAKICRTDPVIRTFQLACNHFTDYFRRSCDSLPLPDPANLGGAVSLVASTDVLEYLMRHKKLLIINRFGPLANIGVITYKQLFNESRYPRSDQLGTLAKYILSFFPQAWGEALLLPTEINSEVNYEWEFPAQNLQLIPHSQITVKKLRNTLLEVVMPQPPSFMDYQKFELEQPDLFEPFSKIRKYFRMPRDRFFKYRILQGDIFCNSRMFKFKMVNSNECNFCADGGEIETIKHMIWSCPRAESLWNYVKQICRRAFNIEYVTYDTVILGSKNPIPVLENIILIGLKLVMSKDRSQSIDNQVFINRVNNLRLIEKNSFKNKQALFKNRWAKLDQILLGSDL